MADENPEKEEEVTPKGAVEVDEEDLDKAAGGVSSGGDYVEREAANWNGPVTLDQAAQKSVPQDSSIGLLQDPQKKAPGG